MYFGLTKETFEEYTQRYIQGEDKKLLAIIVENTQSEYLRMCQDSLDFDTRRDLFIDEVLRFCRGLEQQVPDAPKSYLRSCVRNVFLKAIEQQKKVVSMENITILPTEKVEQEVDVRAYEHTLLRTILAKFCENCIALLRYYNEQNEYYVQTQLQEGKLRWGCTTDSDCTRNYKPNSSAIPEAANIRQAIGRLREKIKNELQISSNKKHIF